MIRPFPRLRADVGILPLVSVYTVCLFSVASVVAQPIEELEKPTQNQNLYGSYQRFAQQAINGFRRTGAKKLSDATDKDAQRLANMVVTGPLTQHTTRVDEQGEAAIFTLATHSGIFRTAFDLTNDVTAHPERYLVDGAVECLGGGSYTSSVKTFPSRLKEDTEITSIEISLAMSDCVPSDPDSWSDHPAITPAREYYARAIYNGTVHIDASYEKGKLVQSLRAYEKFTATAERDEVTLTGAEVLAIPTHCSAENQQVSTVRVQQRDGDDLLYRDFIFGLLGLEADDPVCIAIDRPVNTYKGTLSHAEFGTLEVATSLPLSFKVDPKTLNIYPISERKALKVTNGKGTVHILADENQGAMTLSFDTTQSAPPSRPADPSIINRLPVKQRPALTVQRSSRANNAER